MRNYFEHRKVFTTQVIQLDRSPVNSVLHPMEKSPSVQMPLESCGRHWLVLGSTIFTPSGRITEQCVNIY